MSKGAYVGINNSAKKVKNIYVGVEGIAKKVTKGYIKIGTENKLFWEATNQNQQQQSETYYHQIPRFTYARSREEYEVNQTYPIVYIDIIDYASTLIDIAIYELPFNTLTPTLQNKKQEILQNIQNSLTSSDNFTSLTLSTSSSSIQLSGWVGSLRISEFTLSNSNSMLVGTSNYNSSTASQYPDLADLHGFLSIQINSSGLTYQYTNVQTGSTAKYFTISTEEANTGNVGITGSTYQYYDKIAYFDFINEPTLKNNINPKYKLDTSAGGGQIMEFTENGLHLATGTSNTAPTLSSRFPGYLLYYGNTIEIEFGDYTSSAQGYWSNNMGFLIFQININNKLNLNNNTTGSIMLFPRAGIGRWDIDITHNGYSSAEQVLYDVFGVSDIDYFKNSTIKIKFDKENKGILIYKNNNKVYENYESNFNGIIEGQNFTLLSCFQEVYIKSLKITNESI